MNQVSIREPVSVEGRQIFWGKKSTARFFPAEENTGYVFRHGKREIRATLDTAYNERLWKISFIGLRDAAGDALVGKVEHILSAAYGIGIDNLVIELSDKLCPRFDNGVVPVVEALAPLRLEGAVPQRWVTMHSGIAEREWTIRQDGKPDTLTVARGNGTVIDYHAYYPHQAILKQFARLVFTPERYLQEIMDARGMVWLPFGSKLLLRMLSPFHGITEQNSFLIGKPNDPTYRNAVPYRRDRMEFVRHKILDAVGEQALTGVRYADTLFDYRMTGHAFGLYALRELQRRKVFVEYEAATPTARAAQSRER